MLSNHCQDLSEAALPMTTDDTASVRGGKRFEQIGCSAALKLLESVLDGELPAGISAVVVVDTALNVGDFFRLAGESESAEVSSFLRWCYS